MMPIAEGSKEAKHVDRAALTRDASTGALRTVPTSEAVLREEPPRLRLKSCVFGRLVMNKDGTARAKQQSADVALDVPSGACSDRINQSFRSFFFFFLKRAVDFVFVFLNSVLRSSDGDRGRSSSVS
jgi:hypothetical protein